MSVTILSHAVIATKMADGNVQLIIQSSLDGLNPSGDLQYALVIPSADFTSFNTTVNGGATGATLTRTYAQDAFKVDYPLGYSGGI
jgi:hypothetical protein